jgi:cupin 2 domain-containing protein
VAFGGLWHLSRFLFLGVLMVTNDPHSRTEVRRGRLQSAADAPAVGERTVTIARLGGVVLEQILSGRLPSPVDYDQPQDEWVLLLAGAAVLEVNDVRFDLTSGDWVLLPAHVPHRLVDTTPGTIWLALHTPELDGRAPPSAS